MKLFRTIAVFGILFMINFSMGNTKKVRTPSHKKQSIPEKIEKPPLSTEKKTIALPAKKIEQKRCIIFNNQITTEMITKQHWTGKYTPVFTVFINDEEVPLQQTKKIELDPTKCKARFYYNFKNGYRTGTEIVDYELPKDATQVEITFAGWDKDDGNPRLLISHAKPLAITKQ